MLCINNLPATIAISVTVSGFVALTLSPALCSMFLVHHEGERGGFWKWFDRVFGGTQRGYTSIVGKLVVRPIRVMLVFGLVVLLSARHVRQLAAQFSA